MPRLARAQHATSTPSTTCPCCGKSFKTSQGRASHEASCLGHSSTMQMVQPSVSQGNHSTLAPPAVPSGVTPPALEQCENNNFSQDEDTAATTSNNKSFGASPTVVPTGPAHSVDLPSEFVLVKFHPHSRRDPIIVSLDPEYPQLSVPCDVLATLVPTSQGDSAGSVSSQPSANLCAPFRSRADFEFAEEMTNLLAPRAHVNRMLELMRTSWGKDGSNISFRHYDDMASTLDAASLFVTGFEEGSVTVPYNGQNITTSFLFRNPWRWIERMVGDPELSKTHIWHSAKKFYCRRDSENDQQLIDEPATAQRWWSIEDTLPEDHVLLPLHIWLDKAKVSNKVRMYPIILRALWQPSHIRNASGNGGGLLLAYMPIVCDPLRPELDLPESTDSDDFALYKRHVYNEVLGCIFSDCHIPSLIGRLLQCGDQILIAAVDGEEAGYLLSIRGPTALYPFPKCLAHKQHLSRLVCTAPQRTVAGMRNAVEQAAAQSLVTERNSILRNNGVHAVEHFLWTFRNSDPYAAFGNDTLHSDDLGLFGHHIWPVLKGVFEKSGVTTAVNRNMSNFPIVPELEHFWADRKPVCGVDFSDGETYYSIEKCIIPCIVQELPRNAPLVHWLAFHLAYRIVIGLKCSTQKQRDEFLPWILGKYEHWSKRVSSTHDKNFNFFKQHNKAHAIEGLVSLGATQHSSTRPGEGFHIEVKATYRATNKKDVEKQMTHRDTWAEAIAFMRTAVDRSDAKLKRDRSDHPPTLPAAPTPAKGHTEQRPACSNKFGSSFGHWIDLNLYEVQASLLSSLFFGIAASLRGWLIQTYPQWQEAFSWSIQVKTYRAVYVNFESVEDLLSGQDILRCNKNWNGRPRFDCALLDDRKGLKTTYRPIRLCALLECKLRGGAIVQVVAATRFVPSAWRPNTVWHGCRVFDEREELMFFLPDQLIRRAVMCPAFGAPNKLTHYLHDTAGDGELYLRMHNIGITS
ncbi:hypothetical protein BKA62DRAFT_692225 [Auriculariales sp. MPI-PUGE-AT-0066]|nr:hypothetical protein BKA62DRAFT_692225 [Auriculariales sp. MPI-PUGE-AT-0066]